MGFLSKDKMFSRRWFQDYTYITVGSLIMAIGYVYFITPYKIVPGGLFGIGIVVHYLTQGVFSWAPEGFPIGVFNLLVNIPLTILGIKLLGPRFGIKTVVGFVLSSIFMDVITYLRPEPLTPLVSDVLLSCVFGAVLIGVGVGLIFKSRATSGGSDIVAMIWAKYSNIPLGTLVIYVDSIIVLFGLFAFQDWQIPLYSLLVIYISGKAIDVTLEGVTYNKALFIVSNQHEVIKRKILDDLERGGTVFHGKGLYTDDEKQIIYTVISRREVAILERFISDVAPDAFITVMDVREILGEGFQNLKLKHEE
ncbi:MAG: YitT family protein [Mangrovibacterium sp.]